jgi:hypothetical protein
MTHGGRLMEIRIPSMRVKSMQQISHAVQHYLGAEMITDEIIRPTP